MKLLVNALEAILIYMGINLRGRDVAVAEQFLNHAQIGPAADQVGCKTVPQGVRRNTFE